MENYQNRNFLKKADSLSHFFYLEIVINFFFFFNKFQFTNNITQYLKLGNKTNKLLIKFDCVSEEFKKIQVKLYKNIWQ